jgi:hypothetical protein
MNAENPRFTISPASLRERSHNIAYGLAFSLGLVLLIYWGHVQFPQSFNMILLISVILFVVFSNLIN